MSATGLIVFARMGSQRLPGKMLMDLGGRPLLGRVLDRVRRVGGGNAVVVATSDRPEDDVLAEYAEGEGAGVFRGSLEDVAGRALSCCESYGFERFARVCGDRPFLPWELIDELLAAHAAGDCDLATNALDPGYPAGTVTEIVSTAALRRVLECTGDAEDREHMTRYLYAHPGEFSIVERRADRPEWAGLNLCIDTDEDLERAEWILAGIGPEPEAAPLADVTALAAEWEGRRDRHA